MSKTISMKNYDLGDEYILAKASLGKYKNLDGVYDVNEHRWRDKSHKLQARRWRKINQDS